MGNPLINTKELLRQAALCKPNTAMLINAMNRELGYRKRVYMRLINDERMSVDEAAREIACIQTILKKLEGDMF